MSVRQVRLDRFGRNRFSLGVLQGVDANRIVMAAWMGTCCCKTHCNGCMTVAWALLSGGSRSTKPCVYKVAAAGDEGEGYTLRVCVCVRRVRLDRFGRNRFSLGVLQRVVGHVCVDLCVS